jgi:hypothetical protein
VVPRWCRPSASDSVRTPKVDARRPPTLAFWWTTARRQHDDEQAVLLKLLGRFPGTVCHAEDCYAGCSWSILAQSYVALANHHHYWRERLTNDSNQDRTVIPGRYHCSCAGNWPVPTDQTARCSLSPLYITHHESLSNTACIAQR